MTDAMHGPPIDSPLFCDRCLVPLQSGCGDFFVVRIEAVADPTPPDFCDEDFRRDHRREIDRLLAELAEMSEREAMDQVHRTVTLFLCQRCYQQWIEDPTGQPGPG